MSAGSEVPAWTRRWRAFWTALALLPALALLALAAPRAAREGTHPELSCWVLPNLQVLAVPGNEACPVGAAETIARVRVAADRVLALDEPAQLHALVAAGVERLQVELREGSRSRWVDLPVRRAERSTRLARLAAACVAIALLLGIPLSLVWRTPARAAAPLALFYASASLVLLAICAGQDSALLTSAALAALLVAPAAAIHLSMVFPRERPLLREVPGLGAAPYVACALLAPVGWAALARDPLLWPAFVALLAALTTLAWLVLVLACWSALRASRSALERARARLVLHGSLLVPVLPALGLTHASFAIAPLATSYLWSAALGMPLPIALAIGRYNLFDLESDLRHAIARSLYLALAAGVVVLLLRAGLSRSTAAPTLDAAALLLLALACVGAAELLRSRTLGALEALIAPQLQQLRRVRQELENALAIQKQQAQIAALLGTALARGIPTRRACVVLRETGAGPRATGFGAAAPLDAADLRRAERLLGAQTAVHLAASSSLDLEGCELMERGIEAIVAIECGSTRYGLLLLDAPLRRPPLNGLELEFAQALAARAGIALHNARLTAERVASERHAAVGRLALGLADDVGKDLGWNRLLVRRLPDRVGDPTRLARDAVAIGELTDGLATAIERFVQDATRAPGAGAPRRRLDALVAEALRRVERSHGCGRVRLQIPSDLEGVQLDATLGRAIGNLLDNALHASHDGSAVALRASCDAAWIQIEIEDRGCGIPEPALAHVLEPGFTTRAGAGGSGVGLPVALEIAEALGGALELRSGPRGTRARIRAPVPGQRGVGRRTCTGLLCVALFAARAALADDAGAASAQGLLEGAFRNRYDVDLSSVIELVVRGHAGQERRRTLQALSKRIDSRVHALGRLIAPESLRGMSLLMVEAADRSHDTFLYLPSLGMVRRITTAQRGDAFFGTDVTYEDLERQRAQDYEAGEVTRDEYEGEPVYRIEAAPKRAYSYARVRFALAVADLAILETEYFKRDADQPYRVIRAPRAAMHREAGHVLPTRLLVENRDHGTRTEVWIRDLRVNPPLDARLFSVKTLQSQRPLPME